MLLQIALNAKHRILKKSAFLKLAFSKFLTDVPQILLLFDIFYAVHCKESVYVIFDRPTLAKVLKKQKINHLKKFCRSEIFT